jgi:Circularly permutated YpsA SLOG family
VRVREIWSGGQTGVDRAALDAARELRLPIGGWVPRGRRAEDGAIPDMYPGLRETASDDYAVRTASNVRDCDATLIVCRGPLEGGSALTRDEALRLEKPCLVLDLSAFPANAAVETARAWLDGLDGSRLNVAGPRESAAPGIYDDARALLVRLLRNGARSRLDSA